ncbi:MAG: acetyl-CoA carboxylase biotin carboxyl carrier protein [Cytophagaceae bacterium]|jgi:acetyl-CoA carboxylase biotin carboxyl carrier protein|nr:acetyl-CoA carboxylase biotin carboxyl carrier protein [Cytophagaceae bacterium]
MKPKEIQELLDFIASSGLAEVNIETESFKIAVKRHSVAPAQQVIQTSVPQVLPQVLPVATTPAATTQATTDKKEEKSSSGSGKEIIVKSPMIGTFYRSSGPDSPPFVSIGDEINKGKVLCIVEAMKLFNEIESEFEGRIVKILVENATPVEFDQPLFVLEPK